MKGLIFIPDISGFTDFVWKVPAEAGAAITRELLNEIIDHSLPELKLAEVEGDALLFYKFGTPYPLPLILDSFEKIGAAFTKKYRSLKVLHNVDAHLSIKFILHFGDIDTYKIRSFEKLYGKAIVESHRLLKNDFGGTDYLLVTEDYLRACDSDQSPTEPILRPQKVTMNFDHLGNMNYYFYSQSAPSTTHISMAKSAAC